MQVNAIPQVLFTHRVFKSIEQAWGCVNRNFRWELVCCAILARMPAYPFVPPRDAQFYLLSAHRQPLPANIAAHFIEQCTQLGDLVIDPFVASDAVVRAALERGRRIVATEVNPIVAWAARTQAAMPAAREINAALTRLADTRKESDTLRGYIEKLYLIQCAQCGGSVIADSFVHVRDGEKLLLAEKNYTCAQCGTRRDAVTEGDRQRARDAAPRGLTLPLLTQRLYADDPVHTPRLKRLLEYYTSRNLNALAVLTQKLDAEFRQDAVRQILFALLLHAMDVGTSLYASPDALPTREIPSEFVEVNIWRALESAARGLSQRAPALRLAPNVETVLKAAAPAALIAQGGARGLAENIAGEQAALVLASPARLDPMFWELSFLWTRWLFGKNAATPLEPLLVSERRRWGWYGGALTKVFEETARFMRHDARLVVAFPSGSHAMIEALVLAAASSYAMEDFAFRPADGLQTATEFGALRGDYQVVWQRKDAETTAPEPSLAGIALSNAVRQTALRGALKVLRARGEPLAYSWVHHGALAELARENVLRDALKQDYRTNDNAFQFLHHEIDAGLKLGYVNELDHWQEKTRVLWLARQTQEMQAPLRARVERHVREELRAQEQMTHEALEDHILEKFSGLLTPERELVEISVRACADGNESEWVWRAQNEGEILSHARTQAAQLGTRMGYEVVEDAAPYEMIWRVEKIIPGSASGAVSQERFYEDAYAFIFRARADLEDLITRRAAPLHGLLVLPETQVELTSHILWRDPRWAKQLERAGWEFLRVRWLELLLAQPEATRPEFHLAWGLRPAWAERQEQLELFE